MLKWAQGYIKRSWHGNSIKRRSLQWASKFIFRQQDAKRWDRQSPDVDNVNLTKKQINAEIVVKLHGNWRGSKRNAGQKIKNLWNSNAMLRFVVKSPWKREKSLTQLAGTPFVASM